MNTIEILAVLFTILSVVFLGKGKLSGWSIGILGSVFYGILFIQQKLYVNAIIQNIFILQGIRGLIEWKKQKEEKFVPINLDWYTFGILVSWGCIFSTIISIVMSIYTDNKSPMLDTVLSTCSIVALLMMIRKIIQTWFVWMAIDIGYVFLFISSEMWLSACLYSVLFLICISGYTQWKEKMEIN